jgi:chemotaxis methyl-accepting protein methylase
MHGPSTSHPVREAASTLVKPPLSSNATPGGLAPGRRYQACLPAYLSLVRRLWYHLPESVRRLRPGILFGMHVHALVRRCADRQQYFGTFFFRNRPELDLLVRLLRNRPRGSTVSLCVLACSKGAEVYSIAWAIRTARPDLNLTIRAVDISPDILAFAQRGSYAAETPRIPDALDHADRAGVESVLRNTQRDQSGSIYERVTPEEMDGLFDRISHGLQVKARLQEGITWHVGDARDPELAPTLGPQDIVVANRFLCHMAPEAARDCLRNIARLVKPGGHLFVSGIDLDVRVGVARELGWTPVTELIRDIHEGDRSLRDGWPLQYWGLEPLQDRRPDWTLRYASAFQLGGHS